MPRNTNDNLRWDKLIAAFNQSGEIDPEALEAISNNPEFLWPSRNSIEDWIKAIEQTSFLLCDSFGQPHRIPLCRVFELLLNRAWCYSWDSTFVEFITKAVGEGQHALHLLTADDDHGNPKLVACVSMLQLMVKFKLAEG